LGVVDCTYIDCRKYLFKAKQRSRPARRAVQVQSKIPRSPKRIAPPVSKQPGPIVQQTTARDEHGYEAAPPKRSLLVYVVPIVLRALVVLYVVLRPPNPGVFCAAGTGCFDIDFGNGIDHGTLAFYQLDGSLSRPFPLKRTSSDVYSAALESIEHVQLVVQDKDHLVRSGSVVYVRMPREQAYRQLDALRKAHDDEVARKKAEDEARAKLEREIEEATRAALMKQLNEVQREPGRCGGARLSMQPCHCPPGDPLCSCL